MITSAHNEEKGQRIKRLAIVIGNSAYESLSNLPHPEEDANTVNDTLERLKFEIRRRNNLRRIEILELFADYLGPQKNEVSEIVVYYSGYGNFIEGKVYIGPVDVYESLPLTFVKQSLLDVDIIISILLEYREDDVVPIILILDCYRSELDTVSTQENPLQNINKPNIAVLYSTTKDVAYKRSPYTEALLENMEKDLSISEIHEAATKEIEKLSDKQMSWINSSLFEPYKFSQQRLIPITQEPSV